MSFINIHKPSLSSLQCVEFIIYFWGVPGSLISSVAWGMLLRCPWVPSLLSVVTIGCLRFYELFVCCLSGLLSWGLSFLDFLDRSDRKKSIDSVKVSDHLDWIPFVVMGSPSLACLANHDTRNLRIGSLGEGVTPLSEAVMINGSVFDNTSSMWQASVAVDRFSVAVDGGFELLRTASQVLVMDWEWVWEWAKQRKIKCSGRELYPGLQCGMR